jgi:hypothetical protein
MLRVARLIIAAALLAAPLAGQTSQSADASATVVIAPFLTLAKTIDMDFGTHFASEASLFTAPSNYAEWRGTTDVSNHVSISVSVPVAFNKVGGTGSVPFSCGSTSALITNDVIVQRFNPSSGIADFGPIAAPGTITVALGNPAGTPGDASYLCQVSVANAQRGTYRGFITLTVTVL